jgi:hypothetical protein
LDSALAKDCSEDTRQKMIASNVLEEVR